ncbi:hypothetical protein HDU82_007363 [Entophlyctis luteolus]|nr:hypothetical protein HDU82_007363 [Entophlyctis luteolus]
MAAASVFALKGEGNAHVVLAASVPDLRRLLRLPPESAVLSAASRVVVRLDRTPTSHSEAPLNCAFSSLVVTRLLGARYVTPMVPLFLTFTGNQELTRNQVLIDTDASFLDAVVDYFYSISRNPLSWDAYPRSVVVCEDNTVFSAHCAHKKSQTFSLELKPKWGFIPSRYNRIIRGNAFPRSCNQYPLNSASAQNNPLPPATCRYCMHALLKSHKTNSPLTAFCPMDLYSGTPARVQRALTALCDIPMNNMAAFVDGHRVAASEFARSLAASVNLVADNQNNDSYAWRLVADILCRESAFFSALAQHQRLLDGDVQGGVDAATAASIETEDEQQQQPKSIESGGVRMLSTLEEWECVLSTYLKKFDGDEGRSASSEPPPAHGSAQSVYEFLISQSLKDCSLFLTFRGIHTSTCDCAEEEPSVVPHTFECLQYEYKLRVIDVDVKDLKKLKSDVANQNNRINASGGIPMATLTLAFNLTSVFLFVVAVPFTMFYYEGEDDSDESDEKRKPVQSQIAYALKWLIPTLIFSGGIIAVLYWQAGYAEIEVQQLVGTLTSGFDLTKEYCAFSSAKVPTCTSTPGMRYPQVSWIVYTVALVALLGWLAFAVFGGAGLVSLPVDMILDFQHRPKPITADQYAQRKKLIGERASELLEAGAALQEQLREAARGGARSNRRFRQLRLKENEFRKDTLVLDFHYHQMELAYNYQNQNILMQYMGFVGGCISPPYSLFLNDFFSNVSPIPFIGTALYAIFTFYLLLCVIKGNSKLGMRILFITVHPLKLHETMMNSMLFNVGIILVSSLAVSQFCALAFARYAKYTAAGYLFGVQLQQLKNMKYVYIAFVCTFAAVAALMIGWMIYKPRAKREKKFDMKW